MGKVLLAVLAIPCWMVEADSLSWRQLEDKVDAEIEAWNLRTVLGHIARSTGWQIYLEPDTQRTVSVKFKSLSSTEALRRLLSGLNFALVPQNEGPSKLLIYRTSVHEAVQLIPPTPPEKPSPKIVPNELLVALKPGSSVTIEELARQLGAEIAGRLDELNSYRLRFKDAAATEAAREKLASDPRLGGVESNYLFEQPTRTDRVQAGSGSSFRLKPKTENAGAHVIVGLLDMAVQPLGEGMQDFVLPTIHVAGRPREGTEELSHGTSMAETILRGLALATGEGDESSVRILPVDIYGARPDTTTFDLAKGIHAAINSGATIINMSMGGDGDSRLIYNLIQQGHRNGVLFFGAAGNEPTTLPTFPAAYPEVVAVTAGDRRGRIAPYANRGDFVDVVAPGLTVVEHNGVPVLVTGTSAATAYVSGTAAAHRAAGSSPGQTEAVIRQGLAVNPFAR